MHHPTDRIAHTTAFVTPVVEHWLEREIAQWVHLMKVISKTFCYNISSGYLMNIYIGLIMFYHSVYDEYFTTQLDSNITEV